MIRDFEVGMRDLLIVLPALYFVERNKGGTQQDILHSVYNQLQLSNTDKISSALPGGGRTICHFSTILVHFVFCFVFHCTFSISYKILKYYVYYYYYILIRM